MRPYNRRLKTIARRLRRDMTDSERVLWSRLQGKQLNNIQFYRQKPLGNLVVDFYAPAVGLVIEVDGGQHFEVDARAQDRRRDAQLRHQGLAVLRFDNRQVLQETEGVLEQIVAAIDARRGYGKKDKSP